MLIRGPRSRHALLPAVLVLATIALALALYAPAMRCAFVYDEARYIGNSPQIKSGDWVACARGHLLRALPKASFALAWRVVGRAPFWWRTGQLFLHLVTSLLLGLCAWLCLGGNRAASAPGRLWASLVAGAVFCLHPLASESAIYVWARPTSLVLTFTLAGLCALFAGNAAGYTVRGGALHLLALTCAAATGLCKETGPCMSVPVFMLALALLGHGRRYWSWFLPTVAVLGACLLALPFLARQGHVLPMLDARCSPPALAAHLWRQARGLWQYLRLLLPLPGQYTLCHLTLPGAWYHAVGGALLLTAWVAALVLLARRGRVLAALGLGLALSFLGTYLLLPSIPVVEYKAYGLLAGTALVLADAVAYMLCRRPRSRPGMIVFIGLLLAACTLATALRAREWRGRTRLWRAATLTEPGNPEPRAYLALCRYERGELDAAATDLSAAAAQVRKLRQRYGKLRFTSWGWILHGLGTVRMDQKRYRLAREAFLEATDYNPTDVALRMDICRYFLAVGEKRKARMLLDDSRRFARDAHELKAIAELQQELLKAGKRKR